MKKFSIGSIEIEFTLEALFALRQEAGEATIDSLARLESCARSADVGCLPEFIKASSPGMKDLNDEAILKAVNGVTLNKIFETLLDAFCYAVHDRTYDEHIKYLEGLLSKEGDEDPSGKPETGSSNLSEKPSE